MWLFTWFWRSTQTAKMLKVQQTVTVFRIPTGRRLMEAGWSQKWACRQESSPSKLTMSNHGVAGLPRQFQSCFCLNLDYVVYKD